MFLVFAPFGAFYVFGSIAGDTMTMWRNAGILFGTSIFILALTTYLAGYLSKERIVTTIA